MHRQYSLVAEVLIQFHKPDMVMETCTVSNSTMISTEVDLLSHFVFLPRVP